MPSFRIQRHPFFSALSSGEEGHEGDADDKGRDPEAKGAEGVETAAEDNA